MAKRVSLAAVVGWTVVAAVAFGICGLLRVSPATYLLVLAWGIAAGLVQWCYPSFPRVASALAGVTVLLAWSLICSMLGTGPEEWPSMFETEAVWLIPFGAVAGYAAGTLLTGTLLVQSYWHSATSRMSRSQTTHSQPVAPPAAADLPAVSRLAEERRRSMAGQENL